ncbi:hypothetical protein BTVI_43765 [Pitangus sulphuratus]|nr:hypothetical protein BTVI_43765 [Pitangus sulphuratus]
MLEQPVPKGLAPWNGTQAGAVLEGLTPWKRCTLQQFMKNCSPWARSTSEKFMEDSLPWEGPYTGVAEVNRTKGKGQTQMHKFHLDMKKNFAVKVTEHRNWVLREAVVFPSLEIFKTCLDIILHNLFWMNLLDQEGLTRRSPEAPYNLRHPMFK